MITLKAFSEEEQMNRKVIHYKVDVEPNIPYHVDEIIKEILENYKVQYGSILFKNCKNDLYEYCVNYDNGYLNHVLPESISNAYAVSIEALTRAEYVDMRIDWVIDIGINV